MFFRAVTTPLMSPVPNFNKWCAVSNFLFKNIDFCIFTPKTPLVKENYFLTLWNFTYLKDTSFGKKLCNFELGLETKNEFEKWPLYNFVSVYVLSNLLSQLNKALVSYTTIGDCRTDVRSLDVTVSEETKHITRTCSMINQYHILCMQHDANLK